MSRQVTWLYLLYLLLQCYPVGGQGDEQCPGLSLSINPDADVKFSVIVTIRRTTDGQRCGSKISSAAIKKIAAIQWVVDRMNKNNFTEGIKTGFDVYDDCGIPRNTMARALDILDGPVLGSPECETSSAPCNIGIMGGLESSSTEAMLYALRGSQLPVIGPYATYYNLTRYTNYYRTRPTDLQQIQATATLLQQLGLTYVAVVHTDDDFGTYSAKTLKDISKANGICVDSIQVIKTGPDVNKELLKHQRMKSKHNSVRVVYFGRRDIYQKMQTELGFSKAEVFNISWIIVEDPEDISSPFSSSSGLENGTYIISHKGYGVQDVLNFLADKWNKSRRQETDDLESLIRCSGENAVPDLIHEDIASTIDAVFVFANALQRQASFYCNSSMFCNQLRRDFKFHLNEVQRYPVIYKDISKNVTVTEFAETDRRTNFNDNGEFLPNKEMELYEVTLVTSQDNFTKIGNFHNYTIFLENYSKDIMPSSICNTNCAICENNQGISFAFLDGETFMLGIFAVHETDPNDPFRCSKFRTSQMDVIIIESFLYNVQQMRNETGIKFGAIAIDDCYSSAQTELVLNQILSGEVKLINPYTGNAIEVERIAAVVMTVSSSVTIPVGFLMTELKIPVISASASSPDLDDRINFPYFLRTVPSDIEQARAMISIIKQMGWMYVSLLYVENNYGSKGKEAFARLANESGICIADSPEGISDVRNDNSDSELLSVFTRLINQKADIVVYFGTEARIADFLRVVDGGNEFIFLASEDWGDRQYLLDVGKRGTLGSVTLKNEVESLSDDPLAEYLRSLSPNSISNYRNPWFVEYWEESFLCDLPQSFRHKYDNVCDDTVRFSDGTILDFVEDHRIVHTVIAVHALANGLKKSQEEFCNPNFEGNTFPCQKYYQYITEVVKYIRESEIERGSNNVRVFKDDGNGNIGFKVSNVQEVVGGSLVYKTVGSYEEGKLKLPEKTNMQFYRKDFDATCFGTICGHCSNVSFSTTVTLATTTHSHTDTEKFSVPDFTIIGILGFLVVIILLLSIMVTCYFKRRIHELETQLKETKYEIRTGYTLHNGSSFSHANTTSVTYPELTFANTSPSGDTMYEWSKAQTALHVGDSKYHQSNGGVVNKGFVGNEMYLHATHDVNEQHQSSSSTDLHSSPRGHLSNSDQMNSFSDSPVYRPPSSSYGISSHSSFKKPSDSNQNGKIKKQPRTQLAVPPCRPELPPRDTEKLRSNANRQNALTDQFGHLSSAVPKEKVRKVRGSPRRTVSPPSFKHNPSAGESHRHRNLDTLDRSKYNGSPTDMIFSDTKSPSIGMVSLAGSMEKISRV